MALSPAERRTVLVRLIEVIEREATTSQPESAVVQLAPPVAVKTEVAVVTRGPSYVDKAEAFVLSHPNGVRTREVAEGIGQDVSAVDGSLRIALNKRGTIERRGRFWFPKGKETAPPPKPEKKTIRDLICEAFAAEGRPLSAAELYEAIQRIKPDINKSSLDGEINRMKYHHPPLLTTADTGPHGGGIYKLTDGGGIAADAH